MELNVNWQYSDLNQEEKETVRNRLRKAFTKVFRLVEKQKEKVALNLIITKNDKKREYLLEGRLSFRGREFLATNRSKELIGGLSELARKLRQEIIKEKGKN